MGVLSRSRLLSSLSRTLTVALSCSLLPLAPLLLSRSPLSLYLSLSLSSLSVTLLYLDRLSLSLARSLPFFSFSLSRSSLDPLYRSPLSLSVSSISYGSVDPTADILISRVSVQPVTR